MEALVVVSFTSAGIYILGTKGLRLSGHGLPAAVGKMLECLGAALVFFAVNLAAVLLFLLFMARLTGSFFSFYAANDVAWLVVSLLQGLTFQWWRELSQK